MAYYIIKMAIFIRGNGWMTSPMGMASTLIVMGSFIKVLIFLSRNVEE